MSREELGIGRGEELEALVKLSETVVADVGETSGLPDTGADAAELNWYPNTGCGTPEVYCEEMLGSPLGGAKLANGLPRAAETVVSEDHGIALRLWMPLIWTLGSVYDVKGLMTGTSADGYTFCWCCNVFGAGIGKRLSCTVCAGSEECR